MNIDVKLTLSAQDLTEIILDHLRQRNFTGLKFENVSYKIKEGTFVKNGEAHTAPALDCVEIKNAKVVL